jgi:hypothetical protein
MISLILKKLQILNRNGAFLHLPCQGQINSEMNDFVYVK